MRDWAVTATGPTTTLEWAVLQVLADSHNKDTGRCDPSLARITETVKCSRFGAIKALQALAAAGVIEIERRRGRRSAYKLVNSVDGSTQLTGQPSTPHPSAQLTTPVNSVDPNQEVTSKKPSTRARAGEGTRARPKRSPPRAEPSCPVWDACVSELERELPAAGDAFTTWVRPLQPRRIKDGVLVLLAPNTYVVEHVTEHLLPRIRELVERRGVATVKLAVGSRPRRAPRRPTGRPAEQAG